MMSDLTPDDHQGRWRLEDIDFDRVHPGMAGDDWFAFRLVATASFIESGSDRYASNLAAYFGGDSEIVTWLTGAWEKEELRHGAALRRYLERRWPTFDWESRYAAFWDQYA